MCILQLIIKKTSPTKEKFVHLKRYLLIFHFESQNILIEKIISIYLIICKIEEILYPENVELTNLVSILNIEDFSFTLHDFFNLGCVKNFKLDNSQISSQIKYFNFIEFSKDEKICYLAYDQKVQLFNLFNLSEDVINMKDSEIAENLTLTRKNNSFEVIRYKKCAKENKFTFIISSNENIEASKNYFSNLSFVSLLFTFY